MRPSSSPEGVGVDAIGKQGADSLKVSIGCRCADVCGSAGAGAEMAHKGQQQGDGEGGGEGSSSGRRDQQKGDGEGIATGTAAAQSSLVSCIAEEMVAAFTFKFAPFPSLPFLRLRYCTKRQSR